MLIRARNVSALVRQYPEGAGGRGKAVAGEGSERKAGARETRPGGEETSARRFQRAGRPGGRHGQLA